MKRTGVGLVEVTIAVLILAAGILPVVASLVEGVRDVQALEDRSRALCLAQSAVERLRRGAPERLAELLPAALPAEGGARELDLQIDGIGQDADGATGDGARPAGREAGSERFARSCAFRTGAAGEAGLLTCRVSWVDRASAGQTRSLVVSALVVGR